MAWRLWAHRRTMCSWTPSSINVSGFYFQLFPLTSVKHEPLCSVGSVSFYHFSTVDCCFITMAVSHIINMNHVQVVFMLSPWFFNRVISLFNVSCLVWRCPSDVSHIFTSLFSPSSLKHPANVGASPRQISAVWHFSYFAVQHIQQPKKPHFSEFVRGSFCQRQRQSG